MSRVTSLNILLESTGKDYLAELYGKVIDNVQKGCISAPLKNMDLSGDPEAGSVEAKRFANATPATYGNARTSGTSKITARPVTVQISVDKEIVEEIEDKDVKLYGVDGLLERRAMNHALRMEADLDRAFFTCANTNATAVTSYLADDVDVVLEGVIQSCETVNNSFVDGVPRSMMHLIMTPAWYGKVRTQLDKVANNANIDTAAEEIYAWHGVDTKSCTHLPVGCDFILLVDGAIAQPVMSAPYAAEKIPLSEAYAVSLFYHYGTAAVMPDLIFKPSFYTKVETPAVADIGTYYEYNSTTGTYAKTTDVAIDASKTYYTKNAR